MSLENKSIIYIDCLSVTNIGNNYTFHIKEGLNIDYHLPNNHILIKKEQDINNKIDIIDEFNSWGINNIARIQIEEE